MPGRALRHMGYIAYCSRWEALVPTSTVGSQTSGFARVMPHGTLQYQPVRGLPLSCRTARLHGRVHAWWPHT